jgi:hypothetical protein
MAETIGRNGTELKAQFAAQFANDMAIQMEALGDEADGGIRKQYAIEQTRATGLLDELASEAGEAW